LISAVWDHLFQVRRLGFMAGQILVPDDFDRMGSTDIERLFGGDA
jgi:hypothetical protein